MIGFVIDRTNFEKVKSLIDGIDQADALGQQLKGADAAMADTVNAFGDFVMNVAGIEDGSMAADRFGLIEATLDSALASAEPIS
jgi:hypothetical protein